MKELKRTIKINYEWKHSDGEEIKENHIKILEERAYHKISKRLSIGEMSGDLMDEIYVGEKVSNGWESYIGWWSLSTI